jgi:hypothetical protein
MGNHGGENRVDKDQTASNGQASASPPGETHVTFLNDGGEVGGPKFIGRKGEPKVGLGKGGDYAAEGTGPWRGPCFGWS